MLYFLFLYQIDSGILLYEKDLIAEKHYRMELFGNLFSALKLFLSELAIEGLKDLKTIGLASFTAFIIAIYEVNIDLVIIADKEDGKAVKKITPDLKRIIWSASDLFTSKKLDLTRYKQFDQKINDIILSQKSLVDNDEGRKRWEEFIKPVEEQKGELSKRLRKQKQKEKEELILKREKLENKSLNEKNVIKKYYFCKKVVEISEDLEDLIAIEKYKQLARILYFQVEERKVKLYHYLYKTKKLLKEIQEKTEFKNLNRVNFRDVYTNLYAFSSGLKNFATDILYNNYIALTRDLTNINKFNPNEINQIIDSILRMDEDIGRYFPSI